MVSEVLAEGSRGRTSFCNLSIQVAIYHVIPSKEPRSCHAKHVLLLCASSYALVHLFPKDAPVIDFYDQVASHLLSRRRRKPPDPWTDSKVKVHAIVVIHES